MDPLAADSGYSGGRGVQTMPGSDRKLPPPATVDLAGMEKHSFQTKLKDSCVRCRGKGVNMGLVCNLCNGTGLDEAGRKEKITTQRLSATSNPKGEGGTAVASVGSPGFSKSGMSSPAAVTPVVDSNVGGGGCCVLS